MRQRQETTRPLSRQWALGGLTLLALLAMTACESDTTLRYQGPTFPGPVIPPAGQVVTQSRPVPGFTGVSLTGVGQVFIDQGPAESLTITANENYLPHLTAEVLGDLLVLGHEPGFNVSSAQEIVFRVTLPRLDRVRLSGVGDVDIAGLDGGEFFVDLSGVGAITARGRVDRQELRASGVGDYQAEELQSRVTNAEIHGQMRAVVRVSERLQGRVQYPCTLSYYGSPEVDVAGNGTVRRLGP